jgi:GT2 family glycosyltransferase
MVYGDLLRVPRRGDPFVIHAPDLVRGRVMDSRCSGYVAYGLGIQTCLIRAEVFRRVGGFNERMFCFEDLEFFLRLNRRHFSVRIPEPLVRYHETDGVSKATVYEYEARKHLLRRFCWPIAWQRPSWFMQERDNLAHRRRLDQ